MIPAVGVSQPSSPVAKDVPLASSPDPKQRAASELSTETQGSSWYSPWAWYGSVSSPSLPAASDSPALTAAEQVKEEALARDSQTEPTPSIAEPEPPVSPQEPVNPVGSSISTHGSGWASFFSSKSLIVKSVTGPAPEVQRDENGAEVMELDDESEAGPPSLPLKLKGKDEPLSDKRKGMQTPPPSPKKPESISDKAAPPLTISDSVKQSVKKGQETKRSSSNVPRPKTPPPNLLLPTWQDTFHTSPRNSVPPQPGSKLSKTMKFVSGVLFAKDNPEASRGNRAKEKEKEFLHFGKELPRAWDVLENKIHPDVLRGCERVVVIGIHGWFPGKFKLIHSKGAVMRTVLGEPTGTSGKFVSMMVQALEDFQIEHGVRLKKITSVPLEGDGTIGKRVEKLYANLVDNQEWMDDLHAADAIFVATHSQGSVVSTHLLDQLIRDKHIRTSRNVDFGSFAGPGVNVTPLPKPQKICCLALCGIHLGPLRYLSSSSLLQPYIQYFESTAAKELFEFQNTESQVSKEYVKALGNILDHGTKMVYVASLNDQVVPIYSGLFTAVSHPLILRGLYIDGDAYHSSDFLSNLLVLLLRVLNTGLSDSGLLAHLSEATAGSLNGVGHSTAYEEVATYSLAVKYLFLTNDGLNEHPEMKIEPFNANTEQNDYEIPWALRDLIADERVAHFFYREITQLRDAFREWHPKTTILRDIKRKLQPIQKLPSVASSSTLPSTSTSKL
ncbi:hypothetical protein C8J56DRAFT_767072 [Mycena floridula]|nr:hypothetical protein C8J56DRAFT_767072 [Mycena floridula]